MHKLPSAQEIFNTVAAHLHKQGRPAYAEDGWSCSYRTNSGLSCAVGCLIPDKLYNPKFEGRAAANVISLLYRWGLADWREHVALLEALQGLHDYCKITHKGTFLKPELASRLREVAQRFSLEPFSC